jgi:hypothetical protein
MLAPPIHEASTGFFTFPASAPSSIAVAVGLVMAWGVRMASTASTPRSAATISAARA